MIALLLLSLAFITQPVPDRIDTLQTILRINASDDTARRALRAIADDASTSSSTYERIRAVLAQYPWSARAVIASDTEPGQKLIVSGIVRDAGGKPIAGALLHVFHTDAQGHYARERVMDEPHARLFAYIRTGADGRFEFSTIRPGGYPGRPDRQGEQWRIPSHVHFEVTAPGYASRSFQMVFDDDPRMTPYWHEWARKDRHPVVAVTHGADRIDRVVCNVSLER